MSRWKKAGVYVILALLLAGFAGIIFSPLIEDCVQVLRTGFGTVEYLQAASLDGGQVAVLGADEDGLLVIRGDESGRRLRKTQLDMSLLPDHWRVAAFYPENSGSCFLGLYDLDGQSLRLYRIREEEKQMEVLLERETSGSTVAEQMYGVRLSSFSQSDGIVSFALLEGDDVTVYSTLRDAAGLVQIQSYTCGGAYDACVLADGQLVCAVENELVFVDADARYARNDQIITDFRQVGAGVYTVDRTCLQVFYTDLASPERYQTVLEMEKVDYDLSGAADWSVTDDGALLLLLDNGRLVLDRGTMVQDLTGMLYRSQSQSVLILLGLALAVLAAAFVIWLVICQWMGMRICLLIRWSVVLVAVAVLGVWGLLHLQLWPAERESAGARAYELAGSVTELALQTAQPEELVRQLADSMALAGGGAARDTVVSRYEMDETGFWSLLESNTGDSIGTRAELTAVFDRDTARLAQQQGSAMVERNMGGLPYFCCYRMDGETLLVTAVCGEKLLEDAGAVYTGTRTGVWIVAGFLLVLAVLVLAWIARCLRKMAQGMEQINAGKTDVRMEIHTGDELESLSSCVNTLAHTMQALEQHQEALTLSYRRFVPERVLALLGKNELAEVDKRTFTSQKMATMMVWFQFPQQVYEKSGRELFDNLNEIIERTAPIIAKNGGTVFNFAYDGYDAVFGDDLERAISTAVAVRQEILAINKERELDGRDRVDLRIALDEGMILMGLVGDENQMEPTAISSSFSVAKRLIGLGRKLDANILCTETVAVRAGGYGSRYMGKCMDGGKVIRTYEIYDGDPYAVRRVKEQTAKQFSEGVYMLYSRDFAGAKRVFLNLVHHNVGDGGAKYYLYLADELEKNQDREISLDD